MLEKVGLRPTKLAYENIIKNKSVDSAARRRSEAEL